MKRDRFSSVGGPSATTLFRSLWSSVFCTSAMLRSSRPRSRSIPVRGSGVPRTLTSARNEWPWISSLAAPKVVPGSECAASKRNDFVNSHILKLKSCLMPMLSDAERLVRLHAEAPPGMAQAVVDGARGVLGHVRAIHRLQREPLEGKTEVVLRRCALLRIDQLQFVTPAYHEIGAGFRADANPVHALGRGDRAIGLDADRKAARMQRVDQRRIHLQQRLAAGQDHVAIGVAAGPLRGNGIGELVRRGVAAAQRAGGADKVGVAKLTNCGAAVLFAAAPEIAAGESAKHRSAPGTRAFAL